MTTLTNVPDPQPPRSTRWLFLAYLLVPLVGLTLLLLVALTRR